jgi:hypothetical protein
MRRVACPGRCGATHVDVLLERLIGAYAAYIPWIWSQADDVLLLVDLSENDQQGLHLSGTKEA